MDHPPLAICVFCSSSEGIDPVFFVLAEDLGRALAERGHQLVYGGASVGLMGTLARSMKRHGGRVVGVIPAALEGREIAFTGADELIVTKDLRDRKGIMEERSNAFLTLPGGFGTLEETIEILTLKQIGLHHKPIVILNADGFYDPLLHLFAHIEREGFATLGGNGLYHVAATIDDALGYIEESAPRD